MNQKHRKKINKNIFIFFFFFTCYRILQLSYHTFDVALRKFRNEKSHFRATEMKRRFTEFIGDSTEPKKKKEEEFYFIENSSTLNKFRCVFSTPFCKQNIMRY